MICCVIRQVTGKARCQILDDCETGRLVVGSKEIVQILKKITLGELRNLTFVLLLNFRLFAWQACGASGSTGTTFTGLLAYWPTGLLAFHWPTQTREDLVNKTRENRSYFQFRLL